MERAQAPHKPAAKTATPKKAQKSQPEPAREAPQPVYIEPRNTSHEREANRAARRFGQGASAPQTSTLERSTKRAQLGPDLSRKLIHEIDGGGRNLPGQTQIDMEQHFHRRLDSVRIHDGSTANEIGSAIDARAFTVGQNIFFTSGEYTPGDPRFERLLAHELTHTLQQSGTGEYVIQRDEPPAENLDVWEGTGNDRGYKLDFSGATSLYSMPRMRLPTINGKTKGKSSYTGITTDRLISNDFTYTTQAEERSTDQRSIWEREVKANTTEIQKHIDTLTANPSSDRDSDPLYYLKVRATNQIIIGTKSQLLNRTELLVPNWNKKGESAFFDADHYREHQLDGWDRIENIWLLQNSVNRSAGGNIRRTILENVNELFKRARDDGFFEGRNASRDTLKFSRTPREQQLFFDRVSAGDNLGANVDHWMLNEITAAKHFKFGNRKLIRSLTLRELQDMGLVASADGSPPSTVLWFLGKDSSFYRRVDLSDLNAPKYRGKVIGTENDDFFKNFKINNVTMTEGFSPEEASAGDELGAITGKVRGGVGTYYDRDTGEKVKGDRIKVETDIRLPLKYDPKFGYGAYIDRTGVRDTLMQTRAAEAKGASPFAINSAGLGDDWAMGFSATLTATHPMFTGLQATLGLTADGIQMDVDIPTDKLDFGFFKITEAGISVAFGDDGLIFGGSAAFEIPKVGSGSIIASTDKFEGEFNFDFKFVDPAKITVKYENEAWTFGGELGIKEGVIPGLQSGLINVGINEDGGLLITGNAQVLLPGQSEPAQIDVSYDEENGVIIAAEIPFDTSRWPAVTDANVSVEASYDTEKEDWSIGGTGTASFALPGVTGTLTASYRDGGIVFGGTGQVEIGNAKGEFAFKVGNYPLTEEGEFDTSAGPLETFDAWGKGSVTIEFGKYLTGTAGIEYTPDDKIALSGGLALPPSIELFKAEEYKRSLLDFPRVEFPIFGVTIPVVGSVGIFGFIGGELRGYATVGPATLDDTQVDMEYTLGEPESAKVHGESHLNFGMNAGIALDIGGGLGLGAGIADLTGEVGITAALELDVDAGADLDVNWEPSKGLALDLNMHATASPSFKVGVYGKVAASVALYGEVWSERWDETLAEFGSGLAIGVEQPASWSEENGLRLSFEDATFTYPSFDVKKISSDIMDQIV